VDSILWRRLDRPGHDGCRLVRAGVGWRLGGAATFRDESGAPVAVSYELECDGLWRARFGLVRGWVGSRGIDHRIERLAEGSWALDGRRVPGLESCDDLDFGFTPATNLPQLRRLALEIGRSADLSVAWLDLDAGRLDELRQRYERRSADEYGYEAPRFGYAATLRVDPSGFVLTYPRLWDAIL
jgi:hypothetical protein